MEGQVLRRFDFPAYCIKVLDNSLVAISGGGGTSKVGVPNSIELGIIDYDATTTTATTGGKKPSSAADFAKLFESNTTPHFDSLHSFETGDAIMKFISFTTERNYGQGNEKKRDTSSSSSHLRTDTYLVAPVDNNLEFYKLKPSIIRGATSSMIEPKKQRKDSKRDELRSRKSSVSGKVSIDNNNNAGRKSNGGSVSSDDTIKAISELELVFKLDNSNSKIEINNNSGGDVFVAANAVEKQRTASTSQTETISAMAACKVSRLAKNGANKKPNDMVLLCTGSSSGSITVWQLSIDPDNPQRVEHEKLHVYPKAHGKEVDDLQVNQSAWLNLDQAGTVCPHLLSFSTDQKCSVWSLNKFKKLTDLDYLSTLPSQNLRMRHARYDLSGKLMYTTYIPKSRGSSKDLNSFIQQWSIRVVKVKQKKVGTNNCISENGWFQFDLDEAHVCQYRVMRTCRVRNTILTAMRCSNDGMQCCIGDYEGNVTLYDYDFSVLRKFKRQHSSVVTDLAFYHDSLDVADSNKLILTLGIDRTLQAYKYIDNNRLSKKFSTLLANFSDQHKYLHTIQESMKLIQNDSSIVDKINCLSTSVVKIFCFIMFLILSFCYFFTYFE